MAKYMIAKCKEKKKLYIGPIGQDISTKVQELEKETEDEIIVLGKYEMSPFVFQKLNEVIELLVHVSHHYENTHWWYYTKRTLKISSIILDKIRYDCKINDLKVNARVLREYPKNHGFRTIASKTINRILNRKVFEIPTPKKRRKRKPKKKITQK